MIKSIVTNIFASLTTESGGYSARKLSAFWAVVPMASYLSIKHADKDNTVELVVTWLCFGAMCLSIVTVQQIIDFKNGKKNETTPS